MSRLGQRWGLLLLGLAFVASGALARTVDEIRKEMAGIRRSTNWGDPAEAKAANEKIKKLAAEMTRSASAPPQGDSQGSAPPGQGSGSDTEDPTQGGLDINEYRSQITSQIVAAAGGGKHADILLAKEVREKIVEEYRADVDRQIKNPDVLGEQTTLVIDASSPAAEAVIGQMENFRAISTLIITGGENGAPVDLELILRKAAAYPLRDLYIIGFQQHVTALPPQVGGFPQLRLLAVFGNRITALPPAVDSLGQLETLYVDANPISTVLPAVRSMPRLTKLGLGNTQISAAERAAIARLRPGCQILTQ